MEKKRRLFWLVGTFLIIFLGSIFYYHGSLYHSVYLYERPGSIFEILSLLLEYGFFLVLGGSLSNVYWGLKDLPIFLKEGFTDGNIVSLIFFTISLAHTYISYRILKHIWQTEEVRWYWWVLWIVNCCSWFFMGSIIPLMMRI